MKMNAFEKWQVATSIIQSCIFLATMLVALYIGLKQTEISAKQNEISEKQAEISKSLLDIPFLMSAEVTYDSALKRFNIFNRGQTNIYLWGTKLGDGPRSVESEPRLITPNGGFYFLRADEWEKKILAALPTNRETRGNLELFLTNQAATKYVVTVLVIVRVPAAGQISVDSQTTSIKPNQW
jgi:hypothetical protein